jgi:hypothetical protein
MSSAPRVARARFFLRPFGDLYRVCDSYSDEVADWILGGDEDSMVLVAEILNKRWEEKCKKAIQ